MSRTNVYIDGWTAEVIKTEEKGSDVALATWGCLGLSGLRIL
jgi:hypothetical protein